MARPIDDRLTRLKARRSGIDRFGTLTADQQVEAITKSIMEDRWQKRATADKPHTRYALGAMQEVDADSTRISLETAERVGNQLNKGLETQGRSVEFRLQGSVPLNVHIRRYSDVDLLTLDLGFLNYDQNGARARLGYYTPSNETTVGRLSLLRAQAENILTNAFPQATVDKKGNKAINISGGSLPRSVDVVPSCWYDTIAWQESGKEVERAVKILDKSVPTTISNWPFLHIDRVSGKCATTLGGLRKSIRLAKSVKNDADVEIALPSFDIAGLMYHANMQALLAGYTYELAILAETQRWLDYLYRNQDYARTLLTPDGTRSILNTDRKVGALLMLSNELDVLLRAVAKEQAPYASLDTLEQCREVLSRVYIAEAA
jgi:hypothetical protein